MAAPVNSRTIRNALLETLPEKTSLHGGMPGPQFVHLPASHAKALDPDVQLVVGMRGAGKSFWWAALQQEELRRLIAARNSRLEAIEKAEIFLGFGEKPDPDRYPSRDVLDQLLAEHDARLIWRTVLAFALGGLPETLPSWKDKVAHVTAEPEAIDRFLRECDDKYVREERYVVILFDALDRTARTWPDMHKLVRGLLEVALDLRPFRRLRMKCFLRSDQFEERAVASFPDASKLLAERVELRWPPVELYAMLFQCLGASAAFREEASRNEGLLGGAFHPLGEGATEIWLPPDALLRNEKAQRSAFHAMAGEWMGRDARRGLPYTWVPNHLADARGETSPRSFLAALRAAADDTAERYADHSFALHYESIKRGVQEASKIRVSELAEDYPWVDVLMKALEGLVVPCPFDDIAARWQERTAIEALKQRVSAGDERLPPAHLDEGDAGLRKDLEDLGIFHRLADGRVNIPDVYRVGYGLGRRGGVRPVRRESQR